MYLVIVGVALLVAKLMAWGPFAQLSWAWVAAPFIGAVLWWHFADTSGWTKRRAMDRMEERKAQRRERAMAALGMDVQRNKRASESRAEVARRAAGGAKPPVTRADDLPDVDRKRASRDPTL
jgi:small Trp-rich protein